jgi:hypothetical protein
VISSGCVFIQRRRRSKKKNKEDSTLCSHKNRAFTIFFHTNEGEKNTLILKVCKQERLFFIGK